MATYKRFEDLPVWQKVRKFAANAEVLIENSQIKRNFKLKDQMLGSSGSVMNNIAEGFERRSNKELRQFLFISKGSAGEVRNMLHVAKAVDYIKEPEFKAMFELCETISKMLSGFIKSLQM